MRPLEWYAGPGRPAATTVQGVSHEARRLRSTFSLILLSVRAQAGLVFEQTPDPGGQVLVSSWYPPDGTDYDNYVYDSFQLGS
ncbi:MAG: hypothetical protein U0527_14090 [Candidatus Eisenbacteria bacterium]